MNLIKLIPYATREAIRKALFGKNHFHDLAAFAVQIGCRVAFDVGAERGYERRYGANPSDVDDDFFIDTIDNGVGRLYLWRKR